MTQSAAQIVLAGLAGIVLLGGGTMVYLIGTPARVASKTLSTSNVITSYERFHDLSANFDARVAQVRDLAAQPASPETATEIGAVRQSCREIAASYNADTGKLNKALFKDQRLPVQLDAALCEGVSK